jgi:hypothetical protein
VGVIRGALLIALMIAPAGCDKLFDLDHLSAVDGDGGTIDGVARDGVVADMFVCNPVNHDEDSDGLDDACDGCPTFAGEQDATDTDGDGLPNECDRNNAPLGADRILKYWTFPQADLTGFDILGSFMHTPTNNGVYTVGVNSRVTTIDAYALTRVDFHVGGVSFGGFPSELQIQIGNVTLCTLKGAACNGTGTGTCVQFGAAAMGTWPLPSASARRVSLYREAGAVKCEISDGANSLPVGATAALLPGSVGITTNATAGVKLEAIVIYGAN